MGWFKTLLRPANFILCPDVTLSTKTKRYCVAVPLCSFVLFLLLFCGAISYHSTLFHCTGRLCSVIVILPCYPHFLCFYLWLSKVYRAKPLLTLDECAGLRLSSIRLTYHQVPFLLLRLNNFSYTIVYNYNRTY